MDSLPTELQGKPLFLLNIKKFLTQSTCWCDVGSGIFLPVDSCVRLTLFKLLLFYNLLFYLVGDAPPSFSFFKKNLFLQVDEDYFVKFQRHKFYKVGNDIKCRDYFMADGHFYNIKSKHLPRNPLAVQWSGCSSLPEGFQVPFLVRELRFCKSRDQKKKLSSRLFMLFFSFFDVPQQYSH